MAKKPEQWLTQAEYDMDTAGFMFKGARYFYAVFMCHLSIEKALKGLFSAKLKKVPPKTHNLIYLVEKIGLELPPELYDSVFTLNRVSVPTRYPDDLERILADYDEGKTKQMLEEGKEVLEWIRRRL